MKFKYKLIIGSLIGLTLFSSVSVVVATSVVNNNANSSSLNTSNQELTLNEQSNTVVDNQTTSIMVKSLVVNQLATENIVASDLKGNVPLFEKTRKIIAQYIVDNQATIFNVLSSPLQLRDVNVSLSPTPNYNDSQGSVLVIIEIINNKALVNGVSQIKQFPQILVEGFKKPTTIFVGGINTNGVVTINDLKDSVASDLTLTNNKSYVAQVKYWIASYFANNNNLLFKYLFRTPKAEDIEINGFSNIDDSTGSATIDSLTIINAKCQVDGKVVEQLTFNNIKIKGFKLPTTALKSENRVIHLNELNGLIPSQIVSGTVQEQAAAKNAIAAKIAQSSITIFKYLSQPLQPQDISISSFSSPNNKNGTLTIDQLQIINNKALVNGQPANSPIFNDVIISGFPNPTTKMTTNSLTINALNTYVASTIATTTNGTNASLVEVKKIITDYIVANASTLFQDLVTNTTLTAQDIEIKINAQTSDLSVNNLSGYLTVQITIKNNKAYINGEPWPNFTIDGIKVYGFKKMTPLKIGNLAFQFNEIPSVYIKNNRQQFIDWIKQTIISQLSPNMFIFDNTNGTNPPQELPTPQQINVTNLISNNQEGIVSCNISLEGVQYISSNSPNGSVATNYSDFIQISGFLQEALPAQQYWYLILIGVLVGIGLITIITILIIRKRANKYRS